MPLVFTVVGVVFYAIAGWIMTAPALTAIGLFFLVPALAALVLSFTDFDIYALADLANLRFIGFDNYQRLLSNPLFWQAMGNTMWFVVFGVPLAFGLLTGTFTEDHDFGGTDWRARQGNMGSIKMFATLFGPE